MKNKALILPAIIGIFLILTGCLTGCKNTRAQGISGTDGTGQTETVDERVLAQAKSVYDLAPFMNLNEDKLIYSECRHDDDLQFLVPPVYDGIYELETFEESNCPMYYRVFKDGHNGVLDNNYNRVLGNTYANIYYINENKFIVGTDNSDPTLEEICIVDSNEKIIKMTKGFLCADDDSRFYCADGQIKFADPSYGPMWGFGVMDQDLNTIIEPVYYSIFWNEARYMVEDHDFNK